MAAPEGYDLLARIGFVDKGNYVAGTTYLAGDVVYYNGSTWVALKDNLKGVTPTNGANWKYMARGFAAELLSLVTAKDTSGLKGTAGANVDAQSLMDVIADKVATKLLAKSQIVNNLLATVAGNVLDATQGKALKDAIDQVNRDFKKKTLTAVTSSNGNVSFSLSATQYAVVSAYGKRTDNKSAVVVIPYLYSPTNNQWGAHVISEFATVETLTNTEVEFFVTYRDLK